MRKFLVLLVLVLIIAAIIAGVYFFFLRPPPLEPRPPGTDGAARWAYLAALPRAKSETAADAVLVEIIGEDVMPDGRLAANRGRWTLDFSSFTAAERVRIFVDHLGNVTVGSSASPGVIHAIGVPPGSFPDSIAIFAATAGHGAAGTRAVVNPVECRFDEIAGNHVWTIHFNVSGTRETHAVRFDGVWLSVN